MIIPFLSLGALANLVTLDAFFIDHTGTRRNDNTGECVKNSEKLFKNDYGSSWRFCLDTGIFSDKEWSRHSESIFDEMDSRKVTALLYWLSGSSETLVQNWESNMNGKREESMRKRLSYLSSKDVNGIYSNSLKSAKKNLKMEENIWRRFDIIRIQKEIKNLEMDHKLHANIKNLENMIKKDGGSIIGDGTTKFLKNIDYLHGKAFPAGYNPSPYLNLKKTLKSFAEFNRDHSLKASKSSADASKSGIKACRQLSPIMKYMKEYNQFIHVNSECFSGLLSSLHGQKSLISKIDNFSNELLKEKSNIILQYLQDDLANRFEHLSSKTLNRILEFGYLACSSINDQGFSKIIERKDRAESLNPKCIENLSPKLFHDHFYGKNIRNLPVHFYHQLEIYGELNEDFYLHSTKDQIANWGLDSNVQTACINLKTSSLTIDNISQIRPACFLNAIKADKNRLLLGMKWGKIQTDILSDFSQEDLENAMQTLTDTDLLAMKSSQRQYFFSGNECQGIKSAAISHDIKVSKECFESMNSETQASALVQCKDLDENLLANITKDQVKNWSVTLKGVGFKQGIETLLLIKESNQRIIKNLSTNVTETEQHVCNELENYQYEKLKKIHTKLPSKCFALIKGQKWSLEKVKILVKQKGFCQNPSMISIMEQILNGKEDKKTEKKILSFIDSDCVADIEEKQNLTEEIISHLGSDAFRSLTVKDYPLICKKLTLEQFGQIGIDIKGPDSALNSVESSDLTKDRLPLLTAKFLIGINPKLFETFSPDDIKLIPPFSLTLIDKHRAQHLSKKTLASLTCEQIRHFGKEITNENDKPISLFTKDILNSMTLEQKQAVNNLTKNPSQGAPRLSCNTLLIPTFALLMLTLI